MIILEFFRHSDFTWNQFWAVKWEFLNLKLLRGMVLGLKHCPNSLKSRKNGSFSPKLIWYKILKDGKILSTSHCVQLKTIIEILSYFLSWASGRSTTKKERFCDWIGTGRGIKKTKNKVLMHISWEATGHKCVFCSNLEKIFQYSATVETASRIILILHTSFLVLMLLFLLVLVLVEALAMVFFGLLSVKIL